MGWFPQGAPCIFDCTNCYEAVSGFVDVRLMVVNQVGGLILFLRWVLRVVSGGPVQVVNKISRRDAPNSRRCHARTSSAPSSASSVLAWPASRSRLAIGHKMDGSKESRSPKAERQAFSFCKVAICSWVSLARRCAGRGLWNGGAFLPSLIACWSEGPNRCMPAGPRPGV
mgnify:CR=1 FL=1